MVGGGLDPSGNRHEELKGETNKQTKNFIKQGQHKMLTRQPKPLTTTNMKSGNMEEKSREHCDDMKRLMLNSKAN